MSFIYEKVIIKQGRAKDEDITENIQSSRTFLGVASNFQG